MTRTVPGAFTLIELLVVITIIVVLLALLAPGIDRAMYQAQLAVCGTRLDSIGLAATSYAGEFRRTYPYRQVTDKSLDPPPYNCWTNQITDQADTPIPWFGGSISTGLNPGNVRYDDRPSLTPYFGAGLKTLRDPLMGAKSDFEAPNGITFVDYMLFFSVRFTYPPGGLGKGMYKIGDRLEWTEPPSRGGGTLRHSVLASDQDVVLPTDGFQRVWASHPDADDKMRLIVGTTDVYFAKWLSPDPERGILDTQYVYSDGSVERFTDVTYDESDRPDGRMGRVPVPVAGDGLYVASHVPLNR